jgi:hypothetical protein
LIAWLLHQILKELQAKVEKESQPDNKDAALEREQELEHAIKKKKPDLSTLEVAHPTVGKLVEAGGDALVGEFHPRFGGASS